MDEDDDILHRNRGLELVGAARKGRLDEVRIQLEMGADINYHNSYDNFTALLAACKYGHTDIVLELLNHHSINAFLQNHAGLTAVRIAIVNGHEEIVRCLEEHAQNRRRGGCIPPR